jgi:hypothetical protein
MALKLHKALDDEGNEVQLHELNELSLFTATGVIASHLRPRMHGPDGHPLSGDGTKEFRNALGKRYTLVDE